jgi:hypothetical protein
MNNQGTEENLEASTTVTVAGLEGLANGRPR